MKHELCHKFKGSLVKFLIPRKIIVDFRQRYMEICWPEERDVGILNVFHIKYYVVLTQIWNYIVLPIKFDGKSSPWNWLTLLLKPEGMMHEILLPAAVISYCSWINTENINHSFVINFIFTNYPRHNTDRAQNVFWNMGSHLLIYLTMLSFTKSRASWCRKVGWLPQSECEIT
jgi:hypothetical protein